MGMAEEENMTEKEPSILLLSFIALWILVSILLAFQDVDLTTYPGVADRLEDGRYDCVITPSEVICREKPAPVKIEPQLVAT